MDRLDDVMHRNLRILEVNMTKYIKDSKFISFKVTDAFPFLSI